MLEERNQEVGCKASDAGSPTVPLLKASRPFRGREGRSNSFILSSSFLRKWPRPAEDNSPASSLQNEISALPLTMINKIWEIIFTPVFFFFFPSTFRQNRASNTDGREISNRTRREFFRSYSNKPEE